MANPIQGTNEWGAAVTSGTSTTVVVADSQRHFLYIENQLTSAGNAFFRLDGSAATGSPAEYCLAPGDWRVFGGNYPEIVYIPPIKGAPPNTYSPNCPQQTVQATAATTANVHVTTISYPGA